MTPRNAISAAPLGSTGIVPIRRWVIIVSIISQSAWFLIYQSLREEIGGACGMFGVCTVGALTILFRPANPDNGRRLVLLAKLGGIETALKTFDDV